MRPVHGGRAVLPIRATSLRVPLAVAMSRGWNLAASTLAQFFGREQLLGHCPPDPQPPAGPPPPTFTASCLADKTRKPHCPRPLVWPPRGQRNHRMPSEMRGLGHSLPEGPAAGPAPPKGPASSPPAKGGSRGVGSDRRTPPRPPRPRPPRLVRALPAPTCRAEPAVHAGRWGRRNGVTSQTRRKVGPGVQVPGRPQMPARPRLGRTRGGSGRAGSGGPGTQAPVGAAAWDSHSPFCLQASVRKKKGKGRARVCVQPPPARPAGTPCVAVGVASPCAVTLCCVPRVGPAPGHGPVQSVASAPPFPSVSPNVSPSRDCEARRTLGRHS